MRWSTTATVACSTSPSANTERLAEAGIEPSVGSVGDSYDNALAETINGLYKAEVIHRRSWKNPDAVELATLDWGALVQPPTAAGTDWQHSARRSRSKLLSTTIRACRGGVKLKPNGLRDSRGGSGSVT